MKEFGELELQGPIHDVEAPAPDPEDDAGAGMPRATRLEAILRPGQVPASWPDSSGRTRPR